MTYVPISRRRFIGTIGAMTAAAAIRPGSLIGQDAPATAVKTVRRGVGMFTGRGGTIGWLVNDDALVAVDTQMPGTAEVCVEELGKMSPRMIDLLINSHHHFDHTGGNAVFRPKARKILAHKRVPELQKAAAERSNRLEGQVYADTAYGHEWSEEYGNETVTLRYWGPAHTGGDSIIHFEEANVVHMGDLVFNRRAPYIDTAGGSSVANWITVLEATLKHFDNDTVYIFGHGHDQYGVIGSAKDIEFKHDFLVALHEYVGKGVKDGTSVDELAALDSLKGFEIFSEGDSKNRFQIDIREVYTQLTSS